MLLRSITKHVRDQNWFAVFLDFFIVVVGVFVGLQVANWSNERGDRVRETRILHEMAADIQSDRTAYASAINSALNRIAAATYILQNIPNTPLRTSLDTEWFFEVEYDNAIKASEELRHLGFDERIKTLKPQLWSVVWSVNNIEPSTTSFESLISSGELGILQNKGLVRNLQQYRLNTAGNTKSQDLAFRPARDSGIKIGQQFGLSAFGRVDENVFLKLVSTNPQLAASIQTQLGWSKGHFIGLTAIDNIAAKLLTQIEDELGTSLDDATTETTP